MKSLASDLKSFSSLQVMVSGDFMLDEYLWGQVERISPEAPVAVVDIRRETYTLGGAGNVVNNLAALGARVAVLGAVGEDDAALRLRDKLSSLGVETESLLAEPGRCTSRKTRLMGNEQQMVRIDRETRAPISGTIEGNMLERFQDLLPRLDAIVLSDYGKGTLTPGLLREVIAQGRARGLPVVVDPKGRDYSRYARATVITPNRKEAELAVGFPLDAWEDLVRPAGRLRASLELDHLLLTLGAEGMLLLPRHGDEVHIKAQAREVFDVSGAGDTVAAMMALGLARWRDPERAARVANVAAGLVVSKIGTTPVFLRELERELAGWAPGMADKIVSLSELPVLASRLQTQGQRIVFTNGCFDLLHAGHIKFLDQARHLGDVLVVAVDSDASVHRVKGAGRPVMYAAQRLAVLGALEAVDYLLPFESHQLPEILEKLSPDILTKGSDLPEARVAGREIVQAYGGRVVLLPIFEGISISRLLTCIRQGQGMMDEGQVAAHTGERSPLTATTAIIAGK
ncbi:MAG: D-glycero-beta-D-manno-heptose-7-phosphate kinase [Desulfobaccales bacterium]